MLFSFIMPAWKGKYIKDAIDSILAQDYKDFELVIVDDCSPDINIEQLKQDYQCEFESGKIRYYRNSNNIGGSDLVAQWNHCLEYAKGSYVVLATDDDIYEPTFLSSFTPLISSHPEVNLCRGRILQVDSNNHIKEIDRCYKQFLSKEEFIYHMLHGMKGGIPQYIFKRQALIEKGGFVNFPKAWSADDATAIMMADNGVLTSQEHVVRFRWSDVNISSDNSCITDKIRARLMCYHWMRKNIEEIKVTDEKTSFLHNQINDYLHIYNKIVLLSHLKGISLSKKMQCLMMIWRDKEISKKDKYSILFRAL